MKQKINTAKLFYLLLLFGMFLPKAFAQTEPEYGKWLFINGDKAVQARYALVKEEGDVSHFKVQIRINFEDGIFSDVNSEGYLVAFGFPTYDNQKTDFKHFIIYNSYKDIYTLDGLMSLRTQFPDGSKRFYDEDRGFMYKLANGYEDMVNLDNCVDNKMVGSNNSRCHGSNPWRDYFREDLAVVLK